MSSPLSEQLVEDFLESNFQSNCLAYASAALLAYYVVLNLPYDVQYLWGRRSIATLLSAMNWLGIAGNLIAYMPLATNTSPRCTAFGYANQMLYIVTVAISPLVAALRVHAVSGRNWYLVLPVWLLGIVPVGATIWSVTHETFLIFPQLGCVSNVSYSNATYSTVVIISRTSVIVSDILVVGATWYYISHTSSVKTQLVRDVWDAKPNLTTVMFRDGTLYFLVISLLNIVELLVNIIGFNSNLGTLDITNLTTAMSTILTSRFLICIREAAERSTQAFSSQSLSFIDSQGDSNPRPWLSSVEFAADIANPSARDKGHADAFSDLEDDLDPRGQDDASEGRDGGIELEEYAVSVRSVHTHTP